MQQVAPCAASKRGGSDCRPSCINSIVAGPRIDQCVRRSANCIYDIVASTAFGNSTIGIDCVVPISTIQRAATVQLIVAGHAAQRAMSHKNVVTGGTCNRINSPEAIDPHTIEPEWRNIADHSEPGEIQRVSGTGTVNQTIVR